MAANRLLTAAALAALVAAIAAGCGSGAGDGATRSRFPEGTFEVRITRQDLRRAGLDTYPNYPHVERLTLRDGRWRGLYLPRRSYQPPAGGRYELRGNEVTFVLEYPPEGRGGRDVLRWSYFRGELTFRVVDVVDRGARLGYIAHPWRKVT